MAALSDDGSICGKVLKELRSQFPNYKWKSKLHSNVIRGFADDYNIMIVYFRMSKEFEVCIRGMDINCLIQGKNAVIALGELKEKMYEKKREIEKVIKDLTKEKLEDK